jgi:hypothetical protein
MVAWPSPLLFRCFDDRTEQGVGNDVCAGPSTQVLLIGDLLQPFDGLFRLSILESRCATSLLLVSRRANAS